MTDFTLNDQLKLATLLTQVFTERAKLKISEMCHICVCVCVFVTALLHWGHPFVNKSSYSSGKTTSRAYKTLFWAFPRNNN